MAPATDNSKLGRKRERFADKTFNRVLMEVVGPILIILMIGALVFFLIDIFYRGPHAARLGWVLGLFTIAAVLVARISIDSGAERAALFGFALSAATFIVTVTLVDFEYGNLAILEPVVVIAFIAIVLWCANRLTWDCTMIDDSRDVSSIGLTELVKRKLFSRDRSKTVRDDLSASKPDSPKQSPWFALFANSSTQNTPGLWVFYFAIAAFPIFGFGQWFSQPSDGWGYRWIFFLFAVYLGSGLGLLMLTSLLGLERYVNKRGGELPGVVSRTWMLVGTLFAIAVMLVMLVLPSPSISNGLENALAFLTTNSKEPNKHAIGKDGQKQGDNPNNEKADNQNPNAEKRDGDKGGADGKGKDGKKASGKSSDSKSKSDSKDSRGKGKSQGKDRKADSKADKSSKKNESKDQSEPKGDKQDNSKQDPNNDGQNKKSDKSKPEADAEKSGNKDRDQRDDEAKEQQRDQQAKNPPKKQAQNQPKKNGRNNPAPAPNPASNVASKFGKALGSIIKYLVYIIGLIVLVITLWMFRDELAKLWNDLFGLKEDKEKEEAKAKQTKKLEKPLPSFESFREPFANGSASKWTPAQTIQYTFEALEAWGRGYQHPRDQDQTPHEFAKQLKAVNKEVAAEAKRLADLHGESMFSGNDVDPTDASQLKKIWNLMKSNSPGQRSSLVPQAE